MQTLPKSIHHLNMENFEQFQNEKNIRKLNDKEILLVGLVMG